MKVAVIGAGTAGICAAKHTLAQGYTVTVYDQARTVGGTWVYTDNIGSDEYGLDVHSSMYKGLHTNLPKEIMGYPDFPIPKQDKSYISAEEMLAFLDLYAEEFRLKEHIKFEHYVVRVRPIGETQWEVIVKDLPNDRIDTEMFDAIFVCNGHYNTPSIPTYPDRKLFKGQQIHSHDYRCPEPFKGETVLVIGAGPSGMDLANEISKVAIRVTLSHHHKTAPLTKFPDNVDLKPDVKCLTETGVQFVDGSHRNYSVIFYCTGYKYTFPFLSVDCGISVDDNYVRPLYKHCMNINRPTMALIGLPYYVCASQMSDLQVRFCLKFITGQQQMPTKVEMIEDMEEDMRLRLEKGFKRRQAHMMGTDQDKYYDDLSRTARIDNLKPVMTKLHNESSQRFLDDLVNFRKDIFRIVDDETFVKLN
ncbi:senecionine N-oxygenase [Bradysia coprophila]|uniref:senecionine N-oxygenase n=1 Tax=Bradysia coprophila TaxID=38358 RepID=UPI00187DB10C|nr:senecionine N-oxygenase [Bradysia coprophila]XP_037047362.1 senecionine N-oxygenase [Bradysia coprophila]